MTPLEALKRYFGYDSFRPGQEEIVNAILAGRDALAVMPTGAGKSLCYQVPALLLPGITLVISPLISLMQDQVKALNNAGIRAAFINSSLSEAQIDKALTLAAEGSYKLLYVAPERLESSAFRGFASGRAFDGYGGRGALYQPVGAGFPPQLPQDPCLCGQSAPAADPLGLYGHSDTGGAGGYTLHAAAAGPQGAGDGL